MTRCPKCHRFHNIDIGLDEVCRRIQEAEAILRKVRNPELKREIQHYFDTYR